jgi:O-antigen/teichoic acid export membrane protein
VLFVLKYPMTVVEELKPMNSLRSRLRGSSLARNTLWMLGGQGTRLVLQAIYFLLIARALGPGGYGAFVGAVSLVALVAPFSNWGTGFLLIKNVSRDRATFNDCWGTALGVTALSGCGLLCLVLFVSRILWAGSVPLKIVLLVGISDLILVRTIDLATQAFVAVEVLRKSAEVNVVLSAARTLAAVYLCFALRSHAAATWALLYLASSAAAAIYGVVAVTRALGFPKLGLYLSGAEFKEGFYFAVSLASQTAYNDIDKTMLVRFGGLEATGIYGAAYRIIDVSFSPVGALVYAAYARFFQQGADGISGSTRFAKKLLPYSVVYGASATILLAVCAPLLPILLGRQFAAASTALQWLSPLLLFKSIHYFLIGSLSGGGAQRIAATIQAAIAGINVILNLWLIPAYSWRGAAWASLLTDGLLTISLWYAIQVLSRKRPELPPLVRDLPARVFAPTNDLGTRDI